MSDNKTIPGGIAFGPQAERPEWFRKLLDEMPRVRSDRFEAAMVEARLRRRVATLERRLARVLRLAETTGITMYWTEHNGGGAVWRYRGRRSGWPMDKRGPAGRVWSRKHGGGRG